MIDCEAFTCPLLSTAQTSKHAMQIPTHWNNTSLWCERIQTTWYYSLPLQLAWLASWTWLTRHTTTWGAKKNARRGPHFLILRPRAWTRAYGKPSLQQHQYQAYMTTVAAASIQRNTFIPARTYRRHPRDSRAMKHRVICFVAPSKRWIGVCFFWRIALLGACYRFGSTYPRI